MDEQQVFVVDDDPGMRKAIGLCLRSAGLVVKCFPSAEMFLAEYAEGNRGCLVLDVIMPGTSGTVLHELLLDRGIEMPVVFLTGHGNVPMSVRAMQRGAVDFLEKPFDEDRLVESVRRALEIDLRLCEQARRWEAYSRRYASLTEREKEVMELLIVGREIKSMAKELGIAPRTVDNHRAAVFEKMEVDNAAALTRFVLTCRRRTHNER